MPTQEGSRSNRSTQQFLSPYRIIRIVLLILFGFGGTRFSRGVVLIDGADNQPVRILLRSFDMLERNSILVWLSFRFGPADVGYPFTSESDHERNLPLDFF